MKAATKVNTVAQLLNAAAACLDELDLDGINDLIDQVDEWCQDPCEETAQLNLLYMIEESIEESLALGAKR